MGADAELVATMKRSIATADTIVGQFIDFARVGAEEVSERLDLAVLTRQVAIDMLPPEQLHLDVLDSCHIRGRPVTLRRAIMNLLDNAAKYAGGPNRGPPAPARQGGGIGSSRPGPGHSRSAARRTHPAIHPCRPQRQQWSWPGNCRPHRPSAWWPPNFA
ncbi:hypothetical protein THIARS_60306 [Thiomonas delicata]|uniref:Uncharacterized protein n=1 Tax=Thiomonas delicata TaxID=364030 RepID=A0A238D2V8_THIDL|nr:hypothetical protein THIARS_60306 [Thiomonas delicata]